MPYFNEDSEPPSYAVYYGIETGILGISFRRDVGATEMLNDVSTALECLKSSIVETEVLKVDFDGPRPKPELLPSVIGTAIRNILRRKYKAVAVNNCETGQYVICLTEDKETYPMGMFLD